MTKGLVKLKDRFVYINEKDMSKLIKKLKNPKLSKVEMLQAGLEERFGNTKIQLTDEAKQVMKKLFQSKEVDIPEELNATLREYQERGYAWLYKNHN